MRGSLNLGRIFGIKILIHWTFLFIIGWVIWVDLSRGGDMHSVIWNIVFVLTIFACVVLHELGHSLTARQYGIPTKKITLLPIGGVASLDRMPEDPKQELLVAVAGPAVNLVIAALLYFFVRPVAPYFSDPANMEELAQGVTPGNFLVYLFLTNIILVVFNAIPAFPMDGGRVLRALLSFQMDRVRATQIAANLGQVIAILFFFLGFISNPFLIFIGLFVFLGASSEFTMIQHLTALKGHRVRDAMMSQFSVLRPESSLKEVADILLAGTERNFIVADERGVVGIAYHENIVEAFKKKRTDLSVGNIMTAEFREVDPEEELTEIYRSVQGRNHSFFPVIEYGELVGTIDMENINEFMMIQAALDY